MKQILACILLFFLLGCRDIFTINHLSSFADNTPTFDYAISLLSTNASDEELDRVIKALEANRITLEDVQNDPSLKEKFLEDTKLIADLKIKKADINGLISDITSGDGGEDILGDLLGDEGRVEDILGASDLLVEMYKVDPDSLNETDKLIGAAGLIEDIITNEESNAKLAGVTDYETETLEAQGFTPEEIENIQLANEMMDGSDMLRELVF